MTYSHRRSFLLYTLIFMLAMSIGLFSQADTGTPGVLFLLKDGKIIHVTENGFFVPEINGDVAAMSVQDGGAYYIRHDVQGYTAGFYSGLDSGSYELLLMHESFTVERFAVHDGIFYVLFKKPGITSSAGELVRLNPGTGSIDTLPLITDFGLVRGRLFVVKERSLIYGGTLIPLMLDGDLRVSGTGDDRLVFVTNGYETEVCDIVSGRNVCVTARGCAIMMQLIIISSWSLPTQPPPLILQLNPR